MSSLVSRAEAVRAALGLLKDDTIGVVGIVGAAAAALGIDSAAATSSRLVGLGMNGPHRASGDEPRIAVAERSVCSISFVV